MFHRQTGIFSSKTHVFFELLSLLIQKHSTKHHIVSSRLQSLFTAINLYVQVRLQIRVLSYWDPYAVLSLEAVALSLYCNTVEWFWWD